MITFSLKPDLPLPPAEIVNNINLNLKLDSHEFDMYREGPQRYLKNWKNHSPIAARNRRIKNPLFEQWVKQNITTNILDAGITYVFVDSNTDPVSTGGHTDQRKFVLILPLQHGGLDAKLTFWQEQEKDVEREGGIQGEDLSRLIFLQDLRLPDNCWTLFNTRIIHSVENLYSNRICFQISLNQMI